VHPFANVVGEPPDRQDVTAVVEGEGVIRVQAIASNNFGMNGPEAQVVGLEWMNRRHHVDNTARKRRKSQHW
jgi:hypothetical protein